MSKPPWMSEDDAAKILLLEGSDDCNIIKKFCDDNRIATTIENKGFALHSCGGKDAVLKKFRAKLKSSKLKRPKNIGIILDANSSINKCYANIKSKIQNLPYELPQKFPNKEIIITSLNTGMPKLGIWIMPNNKDGGGIEKFYLALANQINQKFIEDCVRKAENQGLTSFKQQHFQKVVMHTYFTWQDQPGMLLYKAIGKVKLNYNLQVAKDFKNWLKELFNQKI